MVTIQRPKTRQKKLEESLNAILFVDTNIFLNYYRLRSGKLNLELLEKLNGCKRRLVISPQIEMEYKKNRQQVIVNTLKDSCLKHIEINLPPIINEYYPTRSLSSNQSKINSSIDKLKVKSQKILSDPAQHDPVYKILQKIFKYESKYNLSSYSEEDEMLEDIYRKARTHFEYGYPPRKKDDLSCGDAINWQWCLHCAKHADAGTTHDLIIVSCDSDYGVTVDGQSYVNDWLAQEFSEYVSKKRKVILTNSLAQGLKLINASVTKEAEREEQFRLSILRALKKAYHCENADDKDYGIVLPELGF